MSKATKWQKDKLQELADKQMLLPSIDYFVGRGRGMHEMLTYARPRIEKILLNQRKQTVEAINKATSNIQDQYKEALKESKKQTFKKTATSFLNSLKYQPDANPNNVRGLKQGILVRNRDTGKPMHVLPFSYLLFKGNTKHCFPNNSFTEESSKSNISKAFDTVYLHANTRLKKLPPKIEVNPQSYQFPEYSGPDGKVIAYTGELEGVFGDTPVLLSSFSKLPTRPILDNMIDKMYITKPFTLPAITYSNPDTMLTDITKADIDTILG